MAQRKAGMRSDSGTMIFDHIAIEQVRVLGCSVDGVRGGRFRPSAARCGMTVFLFWASMVRSVVLFDWVVLELMTRRFECAIICLGACER